MKKKVYRRPTQSTNISTKILSKEIIGTVFLPPKEVYGQYFIEPN